jgi:hypothetical protein
MVVLAAFPVSVAAQEQVPPPEPTVLPEETQQNPNAPCLEPPPMLRWEDYQGPLHKTVAAFTRKLERKTAHAPHYKAGAVLCSLEPGAKFMLFVHDSSDPLSILSGAFNAGLDHLGNKDSGLGLGAAGYGKRFGANLLGQASHNFFSEFAYPFLFAEDPRYYRLAHGSTGKRVLHAVEHVVVAHRDSGRHMFNFSEWMGTTSAVVLGNTYYPGGRRGFGPQATQVAGAVLQDAAFDVLREFWPDLARNWKLPFRDRREPGP